MNTRDSFSSLQKNFLTQTTFKRNARYYNAPEIISIQNKDSIRRRKPIPSLDIFTQRKIDETFTNSTAELSHKLSLQTGKFSRRVSGEFSPPKTFYELQYSSPASPKLKSFYIERMISRDYLDSIKIKPVEDERMFNNFKIQKHDLSKTCDFSKLKGKDLDFTQKHLNDLYHESKKGHDYCFYKDTTFKTKVNYKLENKEKKRYFFVKKRSTQFPATVLNPEKVDYGSKIATNFKGSNINKDKISPFYLTPGKQLPCQLDMRFNTKLTNFYKDENDKLIQQKIDYRLKKLKQDLIGKRKQQINKSKSPEFTRDDVCDQKYFKLQLAKNRKKNKNEH